MPAELRRPASADSRDSGSDPAAMRISRVFLNRLEAPAPVADTVVVIDVLRSFTTTAVLLARGAGAVYPVADLEAARALRQELPDALTVGALPGGDPAPGFDFGNSPSQLMPLALGGRPVILSTAAGVRGLQLFDAARRLYAASLVCARATAEALRASGSTEVCFVVTGEWLDRDGDEDIACADYMEAMLAGETRDPAPFAQRVRDSDFGRRFGRADRPQLPLADLELAAAADRFARAMPVERMGAQLLIR